MALKFSYLPFLWLSASFCAWPTHAIELAGRCSKQLDAPLAVLAHATVSPYDLVKEDEYLAFEPKHRGIGYLPRVVRTRRYFSRDKPFVTELVTVETRQVSTSEYHTGQWDRGT